MTPNEKALIEDLFNRLRGSAPAQRDSEAESAIAAEMARSPGAAYALVQTVLVQDHALREAHEKMQASEAAAHEPAPPAAQPQSFLERAGSALSGFGGQRRPLPPEEAQPQARQGGGFLQGALQTAAGVAGGALLFEGVRSMFGGSNPLGGGNTTVNETVINEASDRNRDDNVRDASDDRSDGRDDDLRNADYDPGDDGMDDDASFGGDDDDSWI